jgi:hypothetical protein
MALSWRDSNDRISLDSLKPVYHEPEEVREQLARIFGLTDAPFREAVAHAWLEWASATEFDPPAGPGSLLWIHTVRHERRLLARKAWRKDNSDGLACSVSPNGRMAIAVETGDKLTGTTIYGKSPRTNSMKGHQLMEMLRDNRATLHQGDFFTGYAEPATVGTDAPLLWVHLIHQAGGDVLHEVSLPVVANKHNRIVGWKTRIVLPRWRGGSSEPVVRGIPDAAEEPIITVTRRVG